MGKVVPTKFQNIIWRRKVLAKEIEKVKCRPAKAP